MPVSNPPHTPVRDVMSGDVHMIDGLASVREAIEIMRDRSVSSLVIRPRHDTDEYGIVVITDIAARVMAANRAAERVSVYEVMSKPALTVEAGMDIKYAMRLLTRFGLSRALVLEQGSLAGVVTVRDLVMAYG